MASAPPSSNTVTTAFGNTITAGTAKQNTLGYDILVSCSIYAQSGSGTIQVGVGSTSTPTQNAQTLNGSVLGLTLPLTAIIPKNYYILISGSGVTIGSITCVAYAK
jgi:hypothetical protein